MKKIFFLLFLAILMAFAGHLPAAPVDSAQSKRVAANFYKEKVGRAMGRAALEPRTAYTYRTSSSSSMTAAAECFRIYNVGNGFVIVSSDDRIEPVLGYSTEGNFDIHNIPEPLQGLLDYYAATIERVLSGPSGTDARMVSKWRDMASARGSRSRAITAVAPLLTSRWGQVYPYNAQCPAETFGDGGYANAGCVAVAMSQILRYWQYPSHGFGSHSYNCSFLAQGFQVYGILSADFAHASYNYALMPDTISAGSPAAQIEAVSNLIYHCGVSVDMRYGAHSSGAYVTDVAYALSHYFGYEGCTYHTRSGFSNQTWLNMIKRDLDHHQPLIYNGIGSGNSLGHSFVCDGYTTDNYFHFNFGWRGNHDGFFLVDSITPGSNNYNFSQSIINNITASGPIIQPEGASYTFLTEVGMSSEIRSIDIITHNLTDPITITASGDFRISADSLNFLSTLTLPATGGTIYVRHEPTALLPDNPDTGAVVLSSGAATKSIALVGFKFENSCQPPRLLSASSPDMQNILLSWTAPATVPDPKTITWNEAPGLHAGGYNQDYRVSLVQRYTPSDLVLYHNRSLTQVSFFADSNATAYKIIVYKGGRFDNDTIYPGTLVAQENVNMGNVVPDAWNTVHLSTPVLVDALQELWYGVYMEAPANTYAIPLGPPHVFRKGAIIGLHGSNDITWSESQYTYSLAVSATLENTQSVTHYEILRDGIMVGATAGLSMSDTLSATDTVNYTVTAYWDNGCSASEQLQYINDMHLAANPERIDFFHNNGFNSQTNSVAVSGSGLYSPIQAIVSGHFKISTDSIHFQDTCILAPTGGVLYVRYAPLSPQAAFETGSIVLTSGHITAHVDLSGQGSDNCNPPQNLTLSHNNNLVTLNWAQPIPPASQAHEITWCNNFLSNYFLPYHAQVTMIHRYTTSDLADYHNMQLSKISFVPRQHVLSYKAVVYKGGSVGATYNPGTLVYEQNIPLSSLSYNQWNDVVLDAPVLIDATQELWFGIYADVPDSIYFAALGSFYTEDKGDIRCVQHNGQTEWGATGLHKNYSIKGTIENVPVEVSHYMIERNLSPLATTSGTSYQDTLYYSGNYSYTVWAVWNNGCQAGVSHDITLENLCAQNGLSAVLDTCDEYTWRGQTYYESGTYYYNYFDSVGCHQTDTLFLTISHPQHSSLTASGCSSYIWHGETYSQSGDYTHTYTDAHGCTTVDTLHLTIFNPTPVTTTVTECNYYFWNGSRYSQSGQYTFAHRDDNGCLQVDTLRLTILQPQNQSLTVQQCDAYTWHGISHGQSGIYLHQQIDSNGCTQVDTLFLTILPKPAVTITGDSVISSIGNATLTASGAQSYLWSTGDTTASITVQPQITTTYSVTGFADGCASLPAQITVQVIPCIPPVGIETVTACGSYTWHDITYTSSTTEPTFTIPGGAANGCDSVVNLHLTIHSNLETSFHAGTCDSYTWNGQTYEVSGSYTQQFQTQQGCDSTVTLILTVHQPHHLSTTVSECGSYEWNGTTYWESGNYTYTHLDSNGCSQVDTLHLTILPIPFVTITGNTSILQFESTTLVATGAESYLWSTGAHADSIVVSPMETTTYTVTGTQSGCVSEPASTTVFVGACTPAQGVETVSACESYTWHGATYTQSTQIPTYIIYGGASSGCDSIVTLHLTIHNPTHTSLTTSACGNLLWNGSNYTESGDYTFAHPDANGCTQVDTLHLTIYNPVHESVVTSECGSYTWNGRTYTESGVYTYSHPDAHGCTQVDTLHLTIRPAPAVTVVGDTSIFQFESATLTAFGAESYVWSTGESGATLTVSPSNTTTYSVTGTSNGCASEPVTVTISVRPCEPRQGIETVSACDSFVWHGENYYASTTAPSYTIPGGSVSGCDSLVTLHLTIYHSASQERTATACDSFSWNGHDYFTSGDYIQHFQTIQGCDSAVILHLTINKPHHTALTVNECGRFSWNGSTYTASGDYTYAHADINGCTQVDTLHLTIRPIPAIAITGNTSIHLYESTTLTASGADSFVWSTGDSTASVTLTPYATTTYSVIGITDGCASEPAQAIVFVGDCIPAQGIETVTACDSFTWHGQTYTASTNTPSHILHNEAANGCDSIVTLHLTINSTSHTDLNVSTCNEYVWNGQTCIQTGDYHQTFAAANGCDSTVTLHLTINSTRHTDLHISACDEYVWNGQTYTQTGDYHQTFTASNGCDSTVTLHLTINSTRHTDLNVSACNEYVWNGRTCTQTGDYHQTFTAANGCDSTVTLHLTITPSSHTDLYESACDEYVWNGQTYAASGDYTQQFQTVHGCDSTVTLHLTVNRPQHSALTATACESYIWNGNIYTESGDHLFVHTDSTGCTQVDTLHLTVYHAQGTISFIESCDTYTWNDITYSASGDYLHPTTDHHGCTQIDTLHLTIHHAAATEWSTSACSSYTWNGQTYTSSGDHVQHFQTSHGCDSTVTLHLTLHHPATTTLIESACGEFIWNGQSYTSSGDYTQHFQTIHSCDSTVTLHLTINSPHHTNLQASACDEYIWNGQTYTQTGDYDQTFTAANGCDSTVTLHLTITPSYHTDLHESACDAYLWNGQTYTQTGDYNQTLTAANGCDSTVTLHLTITPSSHTDLYESACDEYVWDSHTYTQSGDYDQTFTAANGCDSTVTLHLTINSTYHTELRLSACDEYLWNGQTYTQSGDYTQTFTAASGCDSIVALHLTVNYPQHTSTTATACESYIWNGTAYTETGDYLFQHPDAAGCDQIDTLHLIVNHPQHSAITVEECDTYTWNGITFHNSGDYLHAHTDANGCTQVDTLHLIISRPESTSITVSECESYTWYGTTYIHSGDYLHAHLSPSGCIIIDTLHLTIYSPNHQSFLVNACNSYDWNGETFTQSGRYISMHPDIHGCLQVDTLYLSIMHPQNIDTVVNSCGPFSWYGNILYQDGEHIVSHLDDNGCTQVDTIHLTIHPINYVTDSVSTTENCYLWNGIEYCENGNYTQTFTNQYGCDSTVTLHLTLGVGIHDPVTDFRLSIYPNPTTGSLHVVSEEAYILRTAIYNVFGQCLMQQTVENDHGQMDLSGMAAGTYFLRIETDKGTVTRKVTKSR